METIQTENITADVLSALRDLLHNDVLARVILAAIMIALTAFVVHLVTKLLRRLMSRDNSPLPESTIFINIWRVVAWGIGLSIMLSACFDFDVSGAVTALGVGGIAISLGMQDTISNLIGGLQMNLMGTVAPGDHVEIDGRKGVVRDITWRNVSIETSNGQMLIVPNSSINNGVLVKLPPAEKVVVPINLYKNFDDIESAKCAMEESVRESVEEIIPITDGPKILFTSISDYAYTGSLIVWVDLGELPYSTIDTVTDAAIRAIAKHSPTV